MTETKNELKGNLTKEQLNALKKECAEELSRVRHKLLVDMPFVGQIAMRFDLIPVRDKRVRTACTDYRNIYWDVAFLNSLTPDERVFVMGHEVFHAVQIHAFRRQTRDPELWNIAADMEINNILSDGSSGKSYSPPEHLMFPPVKLAGKSAETLYDWLLKQAEKNNLNNALSKMGKPQRRNSWDSGAGQGGDDDEDGDQQQGGGKSQQQKNGTGEREKRDSSKDGRNTGKLEGQFDKHVYQGDDGDEKDENGNTQVGQKKKGQKKGGKDGEGGSGGEVKDQWGEVGYDEDFRPHMGEDAAERMREAAISAAQAYQREHGNLPAGVEGLIGKLTKPEINWREYLCSFVSSIPNGRTTWCPPSRRHLHSDLYFQSRRSEAVKLTICVDTSGSCIGDLPKFFGEIKGLIETYPAYELDVIQADAAVDKVDHYDQNDPLELDDVSKITFSGGGGTDYGPCFKYIDENLSPDCVVYLGDGWASMSYDGPPKYPVLFLITKDGSFDFCDWGKKVRFKESSWE